MEWRRWQGRAPAWPSPGQATSGCRCVSRGVWQGQALKTPGLYTRGRKRTGAERWLEIRAVMAPEREPPWAQAGGPRKGFGLVQCQKEQLFNYSREALSTRSTNL